MRLVTFTLKKGIPKERAPRFGALIGDGKYVLDFMAAIESEQPPAKPMARPRLLTWFDLDGDWLPKARQLFDSIVKDRGTIKTPRKQRMLTVHKRSEVRVLAPVLRPGKLIAIGLNYRDHAAESNQPIPKSPVVFSKFTTAVIGPEQPVILPPMCSQVDYEAELAVVIGRTAKRVAPEDAMDYVLGYTNFNDVSARDFQFSDGQWQRGKSCDTFAPMGEYIATTDEIRDPQKLSIQLRLNGRAMQDSSTSQMVFGVPELVSFLSETITLEPGDMIATGTPPGVGFARKPPVFLKNGDLMEVEIEGLGVLRNPVKAG
ncbi:MAG TPA: fumarylacetoacetate hydrolase family protein [Acidobacteriota bacterium]